MHFKISVGNKSTDEMTMKGENLENESRGDAQRKLDINVEPNEK